MVLKTVTPRNEIVGGERPQPTNDRASERSDTQTLLPMTQDLLAVDDALRSMPERHVPPDRRCLKLIRRPSLDSAGSQVTDPVVRAAGEVGSASHTHSSG